jgi:hypothetical protein
MPASDLISVALRSNRDRDDANAAMRSLGLAELALQDASPQGER